MTVITKRNALADHWFQSEYDILAKNKTTFFFALCVMCSEGLFRICAHSAHSAYGLANSPNTNIIHHKNASKALDSHFLYKEYKQFVKTLNKPAGSSLFYTLVQPYFLQVPTYNMDTVMVKMTIRNPGSIIYRAHSKYLSDQ